MTTSEDRIWEQYDREMKANFFGNENLIQYIHTTRMDVLSLLW